MTTTLRVELFGVWAIACCDYCGFGQFSSVGRKCRLCGSVFGRLCLVLRGKCIYAQPYSPIASDCTERKIMGEAEAPPA